MKVCGRSPACVRDDGHEGECIEHSCCQRTRGCQWLNGHEGRCTVSSEERSIGAPLTFELVGLRIKVKLYGAYAPRSMTAERELNLVAAIEARRQLDVAIDKLALAIDVTVAPLGRERAAGDVDDK